MQVCAIATVAAHGVLAGVRGAVCGVVGYDSMLAVIGGALGVVAEDVVGGGDSGEAGGGFWVVAVAVWVVAEGEGIEFSVYFCCS
jgi:hypothetical protein